MRGIEGIGKMNPESSSVGSRVAKSATIIAICWVEVMVEISSPRLRAVITNSNTSAASSKALPMKGTWKNTIPRKRISAPSRNASTA